MARVSVNDFSLQVLSGNRVRLRLDFNVNLTITESRLDIPTHIWIKLMERDGRTRDQQHLYADFNNSTIPSNDDPATGWMYAGLYSSSTTGSFTRVLNRSDLPGENGTEEWYVVAAARPDIYSGVAFSNFEISLDLAN